VSAPRLALALGGRLEPRPRAALHSRAALARVAPPLAFGVMVVALWWGYVAISGVSESVLPSPGQVARALVRDRTVLLSSGATTLSEILIGYVIAALVGVAIAAAVSSSRVAERAVYPWLVATQMVPIPAIAPVVILWTGFDIRPRVIVIALVSFFPVVVNTIDGLRATDGELVGLLRTLGARRWEVFRVARLPSALPYVFSGLRVAAAFAVVVAEWAGASSGLGYLVLSYSSQTATSDVFAAVVVLAVIGVALFALVGVVERLAIPWWTLEE
jgi:ABC-type nitrate/sulfonate/bicarbonate transport system permease component